VKPTINDQHALTKSDDRKSTRQFTYLLSAANVNNQDGRQNTKRQFDNRQLSAMQNYISQQQGLQINRQTKVKGDRMLDVP